MNMRRFQECGIGDNEGFNMDVLRTSASCARSSLSVKGVFKTAVATAGLNTRCGATLAAFAKKGKMLRTDKAS